MLPHRAAGLVGAGPRPGHRRWPPSAATSTSTTSGSWPSCSASTGPTPCAIAMAAFVAGRALERIADHSAIIGARLRYLITGEPAHLAAEVR